MRGCKIFSMIIGLAAVSLIYHTFVSAEICNRVVAIVNSNVITLYELNTKIRQLTGAEPTDLRIRDEKSYLETRRKILDLLIDEKIAHEKIQELGIKLTPKEVDAAIETIKEENRLTHEDLVASLKKQGISYEMYRENIKNELERIKLISLEVQSKIFIRDEKISEYYNKHQDEFSIEEEVHLATIFLKQKDPSNQHEASLLSEKARDIIARLETGEDFGKLAKKFSQGPGAKEGGDLGFFKTSQLDSRLLNIIRELPKGFVSEPIISPSGIQIIKVLGKKVGGVKPLEEVKDAIYRNLYREEVNKRYSSWIKELRERAYTKIIF